MDSVASLGAFLFTCYYAQIENAGWKCSKFEKKMLNFPKVVVLTKAKYIKVQWKQTHCAVFFCNGLMAPD